MATEGQRKHLASSMDYLIAHAANVHYAEIRPMRTIHLTEAEADTLITHGRGITMDCSESITMLCKWAGLADPSGNHYNGQGYTGTMLAHLPHYTKPTSANVGAIVVFGPGTGQHAAMVLETGPDPVLFSHGSEAGPLAIRLSVERQYHQTPVTFLSVANL